MFICSVDGLEFDNPEDARAHIENSHDAEVQDYLQEYITEAATDAYEAIIKEED